MWYRLDALSICILGTACLAGSPAGAGYVAYPNPSDEPFAHTVVDGLPGSPPLAAPRDPTPTPTTRTLDAALRADADDARSFGDLDRRGAFRPAPALRLRVADDARPCSAAGASWSPALGGGPADAPAPWLRLRSEPGPCGERYD